MVKPNLFIVGAPKCGTTAWVHYLGSHPDISFCHEKEPHFFCNDFKNFRWAKSLYEYNELFSSFSEEEKLIGEASVMYLYSEVAAKKIHAYNENAKIIVFLRPYIDFLKSYHRQLLNILEEDEVDFSQAWNMQGRRKKGINIPTTCREPKFLQYQDVACFGSQLERYYAVFPKDQIHIVWFDEWTKNTRKVYLDILGFLGLEDDGQQEFLKINIAKKHKSQLINKLLKRPSPFLLALSGIIKKILGRKRLNIAQRVSSLNEKIEPVKDLPFILKEEIWLKMQRDLIKLERITGRSLLKEWKPEKDGSHA